MKKNLLIAITLFITTSCGLVMSDQRLLHNQYVGLLTHEEKNVIRETGEIFKDLEYNDADKHMYSKGTLRILKTDKENIFNFVKVGEWIDHGRYGNSGSYHNLEFRDTLTYDSNGNTTRRKVYDKKYGDFQMTHSWTGELANNSFIQKMKVYDKGILAIEYSMKIVII
jgi:hypothetical protein